MHWASKIAQGLIEKYPDKETFVCASGISPSGSVHIGNFREVVTTYFVVKALQDLGKKTRFIFSWDNYDRFRKVPKNIDSSFEKYIGMPYSEIPDPYGCHQSYAEHFQGEFEEALRSFGIEAQFIYQSNEYKAGRYNGEILHALEKRKEIYDILMEFKTQEPCEEERNNFYPITLYCKACKKDDTTIEGFDQSNKTITYRCQCGNHGMVNIPQADNIKLNWKIDWPMRWRAEDVVFEPGGRDHSAETGSYNVSKQIAKRIFNYKAPEYAAYEFIGIKGSNGKMSSSQGNTITPRELLKIYLPQVILFIFSRYRPEAAFNIGLDEDVIRNYAEYERFREAYISNSLKDEDLCYSLKLSGVESLDNNGPRFGQTAGVLPLINFDMEILRDILGKMGEEYSLEDISKISSRAEYWIKNCCPEKMIDLNSEKDWGYYQTLENNIKSWLRKLCDVIRDSESLNSEQLMKKIYDVCHDDDQRIKKNNQKVLFTSVYKLTLNSTNGPRLPLLIKTLGVERALALLDFNS